MHTVFYPPKRSGIMATDATAYPLSVRRYIRHTALMLAATGALMSASAPTDAQTAEGPKFRLVNSQDIGGEGSWDYAAYDAPHHRLFVARVGGVLVVDVKTMKPSGTISALAGTRTHGVAFAADLSVGMTSDGDDETSTVFDLASLSVLRRISLKHSPDGIVYDAASHRGVAFGGDDQVAVAFDPVSGKLDAEVKLPGSPEAGVVDGKGRLYVNLADKGEIAEISTRRWVLERHWSIGNGCEEPTPLAIDPTSDRLFVGCRSGVLAVIDPRAQSVVAAIPIGKGADAIAYEPRSHLIFVACYDGSLTIVKEDSPSSFRVVQTVATAPAARTLALDPVGPRVFLPVAALGPLLPKRGDAPGRPAVIPSTFKILTVSR